MTILNDTSVKGVQCTLLQCCSKGKYGWLLPVINSLSSLRHATLDLNPFNIIPVECTNLTLTRNRCSPLLFRLALLIYQLCLYSQQGRHVIVFKVVLPLVALLYYDLFTGDKLLLVMIYSRIKRFYRVFLRDHEQKYLSHQRICFAPDLSTGSFLFPSRF